jgi:hypothetical protein
LVAYIIPDCEAARIAGQAACAERALAQSFFAILPRDAVLPFPLQKRRAENLVRRKEDRERAWKDCCKRMFGGASTTRDMEKIGIVSYETCTHAGRLS